MADDSDQEKTEQPTEKRLKESREKGEVPRSRDLTGAAVVLAGVAALMAGGPASFAHAQRIFRIGLGYSRDALFSDTLPARALAEALHEALALFAPVAIATLVAALGAPLIIGGLNFSGKALQPKLERLDPIKGLGRIFAVRGLVELAKALLKVIFIGVLLALLLRHWQGDMLQTGRGPVFGGIALALGLLGQAGLWFGAILAVIGGIDAVYQKYDYTKNLRMSRQEIKDEMKESEGSPEIKSRVRQVQQAQARRRMMQDVPKADVVVVNPTHFAVALRYDDGKSGAPRVLAKGADLLAQQIRTVAGEHRIPLVEAPPLARALYASTEVGREIPAALYVAVAQVLVYVYQLKQAVAHGDAPPVVPNPEVDPDLMGPYRM
ncbi:MAG: flagellar biosynthesis protein FlhB [Rhodanobacter sp.]|nr:MAG: flagellar biosynthesis protein FlhB [Rhodanobacter sp.]TAM13801.1 MAG: flagellar biosynthesis protein FlhB [Rhodanobacter sp.]TAM37712.1 MAG: flagellar biosynthesis protein FlhB [Rhodanobacter sp.]